MSHTLGPIGLQESNLVQGAFPRDARRVSRRDTPLITRQAELRLGLMARRPPAAANDNRRRSLVQRLARALFSLTLLSCAVIPAPGEAATTCSAPRDLFWLDAPLPRT